MAGESPHKAVFLSYASQDAEAARRICDALRASGVEVWFDADGGLEHGDEWDAKIRRQIKECVLFLAVISANTQAREEGYFRIEWELAAQRALGIASGVAFILPVVIDDTKEPAALVPDRFRAVQWTRLRDGEVAPEVLQRFLKLWSHRTGVLKQAGLEREVRSAGSAAPADSREPNRQPKRAAWPWVALGLAALVAAYLVVQPRHRPAAAPAPIAIAAGATQTIAAPPGVRAWPKDPELKRAYQLSIGLNSIREDLLLAEEMAKKVADRAPSDPEAVTVLAHVESTILVRNFDFTADRTTLARRYCERAVQLAPDDPVALVALAMFLTQRGGDIPRAETLLRQAVGLAPDEPRFARYLARVVGLQNGAEGLAESLRQYQAITQRFPQDALAHYDLAIRYRDNGDFAAAERALDATIALAPVANAIDWKARLALMRGELPEAKVWLERVPPRLQAEERAVLTRVTYGLFSGDVTYGLQALNRYAEPWFYDISNFSGPRSLLLAMLRDRQGNPELARTHYEAALTEIRRYREAHPSDPGTQGTEAWVLRGLGRIEEARAAHRISMAGAARPIRHFAPGLWWFSALPRMLLLDDRDKALAGLREAAEVPAAREHLLRRIRMDPRLAAFHQDPAIIALLASPPEKEPPPVSAAVVAKADDKSVAVLAFANLSDDKANEYFSDGISEELLNVLAKVPLLKVAARTSSFFFKGKEVPVPEIARQLGVAYVVEGSVRKAGQKVRITAQLIKAADGFHVWSETYDRDLTDIFAVQDEIAKSILGIVKGRLLGEAELPHLATTKIEAYTLYLQAQGAFARRGEAGLRESIHLFAAALAIAPDYVPALVGLAQAQVVLPNYAYLSGAKARATTAAALQAARRALELDPRNAAAFAVIGWAKFQCEWQWAESDEALRRARDLAPNDAWNWNCLGDYYRFIGDLPQALVAKQREWDLDPLSPNSQWDLSYLHLVAGNYDQSIQWGERSIQLAPHNVDSYMTGILATGRAGRFEAMHRLLAAARQNVHEGEGMLLLLEAYGAIIEKKPEDARRTLAAVMPLAEDGTASPAYVGYCHLLLGDAAQAAVWLRKGYDRSDPAMVWNEIIDFDVIAAHPLTRPILDQPGLKELYDLRQRNARAGLNKL